MARLQEKRWKSFLGWFLMSEIVLKRKRKWKPPKPPASIRIIVAVAIVFDIYWLNTGLVTVFESFIISIPVSFLSYWIDSGDRSRLLYEKPLWLLAIMASGGFYVLGLFSLYEMFFNRDEP